MSKMMMRSDCKPPLARSPIRLRPRRVLRSNSSNAIQSPPVFLTKSELPKRPSNPLEELELRPEYRSISCEFKALAKMVQDEFGNTDISRVPFGNISNANTSPLFERGRFYEEYSARRNERLKRKYVDTGDEKKSVYGLGVRVESAKRKEVKKVGSVRKTVPITPMMERRENSRYLLRGSSLKENKKPPLAVSFEKACATDRKVGVRRTRKIGI